MKKRIIVLTILAACMAMEAIGQVPQAFKYQAIARDNSGNIISDTKVSFRMSILQGSITGPVSYEETDTATTNQFGLANISIGAGTPIVGKMSSVNWGNGPYFMKIEFDPAGGNNFTFMGGSQLLSVPYALYSQTTGDTAMWSTTGNLHTNPLTNYIGTNDTEGINIRVYDSLAGLITYGIPYNTGYGVNTLIRNKRGYYNAAFGFDALNFNVKGYNDVGVGWFALRDNIYGNGNTAIGAFADEGNGGSNNTAVGASALGGTYPDSGSYNSAVGVGACGADQTGQYNSGFGYKSLNQNRIGNHNAAFGAFSLTACLNNDNSAFGYAALFTLNTGTLNVALGDSALFNSIACAQNTAAGASAMLRNVSGNYNEAYGYQALYSNISGNNNIAIGDQTLWLLTNGIDNVAIGSAAMWLGNSSYNTAIGYQALQYSGSISASYNTALGWKSMAAGITYRTGIYNTATGALSLYSVTSGSNNTADGYEALYLDTAGADNTANGYESQMISRASYNTSTGYLTLSNNTTGQYNSAFGFEALGLNTIDGANTANGAYVLYNNTTGGYNTGLGYRALNNNNTGSSNTAIGSSSGYNNTGNKNTFLGDSAGYSTTSGNNITAIGYQAVNTTPNTVQLGNSKVINVNIAGALSVPYDTTSITGGTKTVAQGKQVLIMTGAGGIAITINFPASPLQGQLFSICGTASFATVTFSSLGNTFANPPVSIVGGIPLRFIFYNNVWYNL